MLDILKSAQARRQLLWISVLIAIILVVVVIVSALQLAVDPPISLGWRVAWTTIQVIASGLFGGVAAAAFVAFITGYLFKLDAQLEKISVLDTLTSHSAHLDAIAETDYWWHDGHIGRWVRTTVLPRFADVASEGGRRVRFVILDPLNDDAIAAYAEHRDLVDAIPEGTDTKVDARVEVLATIIRSAHYQQWVPGVDVEISLRSDLSLFRVDVCSVGAFTTLTRSKAPALEFRDGRRDADHYWAAEKNFEYAFSKGRRVDLQESLPKEPSTQDVEQFLGRLGLAEYSHLAADALQRSRSAFNRTP